MTGSLQWILAHQGGWDELLMFGIPVVLAIVAVRWAEKRGRERTGAGEDRPAADEPGDAEH